MLLLPVPKFSLIDMGFYFVECMLDIPSPIYTNYHILLAPIGFMRIGEVTVVKTCSLYQAKGLNGISK